MSNLQLKQLSIPKIMYSIQAMNCTVHSSIIFGGGNSELMSEAMFVCGQLRAMTSLSLFVLTYHRLLTHSRHYCQSLSNQFTRPQAPLSGPHPITIWPPPIPHRPPNALPTCTCPSAQASAVIRRGGRVSPLPPGALRCIHRHHRSPAQPGASQSASSLLRIRSELLQKK